MTNFIYNNTTVPINKMNAAPLPPGANPNQWGVASEWITLCQALLDIQGWARGAQWMGMVPLALDPAPAGVADYVWLRNDDVWMHNNTPLGGGGGGTVTSVGTGVGLTGGPIVGSGTINLANTAVTPGSYTNVNLTVDAQGRITAATNGTAPTAPAIIFDDSVPATNKNIRSDRGGGTQSPIDNTKIEITNFGSTTGGSNGATGQGATIGGGLDNDATGLFYPTVAGGTANLATNGYASIGGGQGNEANGISSTVGGGQGNIADADRTTVGGGDGNTATAQWGTVAGGNNNDNEGISSFVGGGEVNFVAGLANNSEYHVIGGGLSNEISGLNPGDYIFANFIGGGYNNRCADDTGVIGGGQANLIHPGNEENWGCVIGGGYLNVIGDPTAVLFAPASTIAGGRENQINNSAECSAIGGGQNNVTDSPHSTMGGGLTNNIGNGGLDADYGVIGGGESNTILSGSHWATISGGQANTTGPGGAHGATIVGGRSNSAYGPDSIAGGTGTWANGAGAVALGIDGQAGGRAAATVGEGGAAAGDASFTAGTGSSAAGDFSGAIGDAANASGFGSFAAGEAPTAAGSYGAAAFGNGAQASSDSSFATGYGVAAGIAAVALGDCTANDYAAFACNYGTANGEASAAIGFSQAKGYASFSRGDSSQALRDGQSANANGSFTGVKGQAQHSELVLKGTTPGSVPTESVELSQSIVLEDNKAYTFKVQVIAGAIQTGPTRVQRSFELSFCAQRTGGVSTIVATETSNTYGDVAAADWTFVASIGVAPDRLVLTFTTGAITSASRVVANVAFTECLF